MTREVYSIAPSLSIEIDTATDDNLTNQCSAKGQSRWAALLLKHRFRQSGGAWVRDHDRATATIGDDDDAVTINRPGSGFKSPLSTMHALALRGCAVELDGQPTSSLSAAAQLLCELGYRVFCLAPASKRPGVTVDGKVLTFRDATTDVSKVRSWWAANPSANIGIATAGLTVCDIDDGSLPWINDHMAGVRAWQSTPRGGRHLLYKGDCRCAVGLLKSVDLRGQGGYIVAAPSRLNDKEVYNWHQLCAVDELGAVPDWLAFLIEEREARHQQAATAPVMEVGRPHPPCAADVSDRARLWLAKCDPSVEGQNGSGRLAHAVNGLLWGFGLDAATALQLLDTWNLGCRPPWSEKELAHAVDRIGKRPDNRGRGFLLGKDRDRPPRGRGSVVAVDDRDDDRPPIECLTPPDCPGDDLVVYDLDRGDDRPPLETLAPPDCRPGATAGDTGATSAPKARKISNYELLDLFRTWPVRFNELSGYVERDGEPIRDLELIYKELCAQGISAPKVSAIDSLLYIAKRERSYDPLLDDLTRCEQLPPLPVNRLASQYLRVGEMEEPPTLHDRMLEISIVGAVKRALEPGCQFDTATILTGPQGIGKSSFWRALAGDRFFSDSVSDVTDKDALMQLHATWFVELGELDFLTGRAHVGQIKSFLSVRSDAFRVPYGRSIEVFPRRCAIVGSSNDPNGVLRDDTGSRRFHLIPCTVNRIDIEAVLRDRDRIISGAIAAYRAGVQTWLNADDQARSEELNEDARGDHPWAETVLQYAFARVGRFSTEDVLEDALGVDKARLHTRDAAVVSNILRKNGFIQERYFADGQRRRGWTRAH